MKNINRNWIYPLFIMGVFLMQASSCEKDEVPVLTTSPVTNISTTSVISGGNIISDGGSTVTAQGVCWSQNITPGLSDSKTSDGTGTGSFISSLTGLTKNTTYYVRAYATNIVGTAFGNELTFTTYGLEDIDGNRYHSIKIGTQEWMQENLKTKHYSDGSVIPNVMQTIDWVNLSSGAYCDYDNNTNNVATYGRLYNWYAVADNRNVCPSGWHAPSLDEWYVLINTLGGENIAGGKMKSIGTLQNGDGLWYSPNTGATNSSGFTGLPAGTRFVAGDFRDLHSFGNWWSSDGSFGSAWSPRLQDTHTMVEWFNNYVSIGKSVRCIKD